MHERLKTAEAATVAATKNRKLIADIVEPFGTLTLFLMEIRLKLFFIVNNLRDWN